MPNSSVICVDASIVVRYLTDLQHPIHPLWRRWVAEDRRLVAPTLLPYEVINALHRYLKAGIMTATAAARTHETALRLPIALYGDRALHRRARILAAELSLPATYDAHYLALAERLGAEFWTADQRLARAGQSAYGWVNLLA